MPPDVKSMRCLPASWVVPTGVVPIKIWDDTGAGGGKPGSIWIINTMDMVAFSAGHDAPTEQFYELHTNKFFVEGLNSMSKGV